MLFEECDDLAMKLRLREAARAQRIPVLMETSDRGMIDVERFDLEPERPLLHGLAGELRAEDLTGLTTYQKVPAVLRIIGVDTMSERLGASMPDIDTTLKTWPQLASAVALGGALNTDVARRIALGTMTRSGRFFVDFSDLVADAAAGDLDSPEPQPETTTPRPPRIAPLIVRSSETIGVADVRRLVDFAALAPSGGNCQPWAFTWRDASLELRVHPERGKTLLDHRRFASLLALGAALEYLETAARSEGWAPTTVAFPEEESTNAVVARVTFDAGQVDADAAEWRSRFGQRVTNRRLGRRAPLPDGVLAALDRVAAEGGTSLYTLSEPGLLERAGEVLAEGDRFRFMHPRLHSEMFEEIRFTDQAVEATHDGIDLAALEMDPTQVAGTRMLRRRAFVDRMVEMDSGQGLGRATRQAVAASSALAILRSARTGPLAYLEGGRALARVWASATDHALAFQPMSALLYLLERLRDGGEGFDAPQRSHLERIRRDFVAVLGAHEGTDLLLFRLAPSPGAPTARSPRKPADEVLTVRG